MDSVPVLYKHSVDEIYNYKMCILQTSAFPQEGRWFPQGDTCATNKAFIFSRIYWKKTQIIYNIMSLTHWIVYFEIFLSLFQEINWHLVTFFNRKDIVDSWQIAKSLML